MCCSEAVRLTGCCCDQTSDLSVFTNQTAPVQQPTADAQKRTEPGFLVTSAQLAGHESEAPRGSYV